MSEQLQSGSTAQGVRLEHPRLKRLYSFWDLRRGDRPMPRRSDFLPEEFYPWMGHLSIIAVEGEAASRLRFKVRLCGLAIVEYDGIDLTGRYLDEELPSHTDAAVLGAFTSCVHSRSPQSDVIWPPFEGSTLNRLHRLLCPCGEDGLTVDRILVGVYAEPQDRIGKGSVYDAIYDPAALEERRSRLSRVSPQSATRRDMDRGAIHRRRMRGDPPCWPH